MRRIVIMLCTGIALASTVGVVIHQFSRDSTKYCRIRFGTATSHDVVLARTSDSLLLFRSGDTMSTPERYSLDDGSLPAGVTIPRIEVGNGTSYTITSISEYEDDEPAHRHALILHTKIDGHASFTQYCDVELSGSMHGSL